MLPEAAERLGIRHKPDAEEALLTEFGDLFRTGYLTWGMNLANPSPPFCHVTELGRRALKNLSRDSANPDGYLAHLASIAPVSPLALSYLRESLSCFVADLPKAGAVMVGAAAESLVLEFRDPLVARFAQLGKAPPTKLTDWKVKMVVDSVYALLVQHKSAVPRWDAVEGYWPAFIQQIRAARNEAGHPSSIDPVTIDTVHASLLIFPELARLAAELRAWAATASL